MTTASVQHKIRTAMSDWFITATEAKDIVTEAEKGIVTAGEASAISDLFDRGARTPPPGQMVTLAIPENPGEVTLELGAKSALEAFFARNNVPAGAKKAEMKGAIKALLANTNVGSPLAKKPNEARLFALPLSNPLDVARDLPMQTALIDLKKGEFFLKSEGGFVVDPRAKFYGPFPIPATPAATGLSSARIDQIRAAFGQASQAGTLAYQPGGVIESHLGVRFEKAELMRERHPDGFTYTAYVPVGALTPTAPKADPNTVRDVYIERTGGIAGLTQHVMIHV
jgi:hypothetical protein